jgi:hypothetical protein
MNMTKSANFHKKKDLHFVMEFHLSLKNKL